MRIDVKKFLFIGYGGAHEVFFEKAQEIGLVHFIDPLSSKSKEAPEEIQLIIRAIKVVRELPALNQEEPEDAAEALSITKKILGIKHKVDRLEEDLRTTRLELARTAVFGDFSLQDIGYIEKEGARQIQFFFSKKGALETIPENVFFVASDHGLDYYIAINQKLQHYQNLIEMKIEHDPAALQQKIQELQNRLHEQHELLKGYSKYHEFLHHILVQFSNAFHLENTKSLVTKPMEGKLFAIEGWVPENRVEELKGFLEPVDVHMAQVSVEEDEVIPTYLENKGLHRVGEDLVHIYDTPSATDFDPSLWVLVSFALFFAMIIGDGGYGLIFLATALYIRYKQGSFKKQGARLFKLALILTTASILWGVLSNSFFGISFGPESPVRRVSLVNWLVEKKADYHFVNKTPVYDEWVVKYPELALADTSKAFLQGAAKGKEGNLSYEMINRFSDSIMMELALLVGVIHISLSYLRYVRRNWSAIGWVMGIIGAYLALPYYLNATSLMHYVFGFDSYSLYQEGLLMMGLGLSLAIGISLIKNKLWGLLDLANIIQIFADVLSYLRLYALGLAGAIISITVNDIAGSLNFVLGGLLLLVGHGLNIVLAVIGGVIHGLRLNFIEWYHYSFEGGGKQFNPLRKTEIE